ncbi:glycosyltransferase [Flaviaesturariibacter terrae]
MLSDNRYGLHAGDIPSIFLCHQLSIRSGLGRLADNLLRRRHYRMIGKFSACWVPDWQEPALAGTLSHPPVPPPIPTRYIGPLSRFRNANERPASNTSPATTETQHQTTNYKPQTTNWPLLVALSGPEPQRTLWEESLLPQLALLDGPVLLLRGLPGDTSALAVPRNVQVAAHLPAVEMAATFSSARYVVARCGYSTVMDLVALRCKGILVPTPGQTEQEYLARHLTQQRIALCYRAEDFDLQQALHAAEEFDYCFPERKTADGLDEALNELLATISRSTANQI